MKETTYPSGSEQRERGYPSCSKESGYPTNPDDLANYEAWEKIFEAKENAK